MKLSLINIDLVNKDPKLGLAYIAAYLNKFNFNKVSIIDKEDPIKAVQREKPDLIGMYSSSVEYASVKKIAETIKSKIDVPIIIGGPHISSVPQKMDNVFDIGVIGEGEQTMLELMQHYEKCGVFEKDKLRKIDGIVYRDNTTIKQTNIRKLIEPLDIIPYPARDLLNMKYYLQLRQFTPDRLGKYVQMMTSRGCPYKCVFCASRVFWRTIRFHTPNYVVNEMKQIVEKYHPSGIVLYDDLFIANKKRLEEIVNLIKGEGIDVEFYIEAKANLINEEVCKLLKKMNVVLITFGLESGSERVLRYLKKGTVTIKDNYRAIKMCKKYGMSTQGLFMMGSPDETEEDLQETLKLVTNENLDFFHVWHLTPFPGTEVWKYAESKGLVSDSTDLSNFSGNYNKDIILTDKISKEKFKQWYDLFQEEMKRKWYKKAPKFKIENVVSLRFMLSLLRKWKTLINYLKYKK